MNRRVLGSRSLPGPFGGRGREARGPARCRRDLGCPERARCLPQCPAWVGCRLGSVEWDRRSERRRRRPRCPAWRWPRPGCTAWCRQPPRCAVGPPLRRAAGYRCRRRPRRERRRCGRRVWRRPGRRRRGGRRQQGQWVDVGVAGARFAHSEVQVGRGRRALARGSDRADALAARHVLSGVHRQRRQVQVGGVETVAGPHAHRQPRRARCPGEAHLSSRGGHHRRPDRCRDVDAAVLSARVRVRSVSVRGDHLAADGPKPRRLSRPGKRGRGREERCEDEQKSAHPENVQARAQGGEGGVAGLLRLVTRR